MNKDFNPLSHDLFLRGGVKCFIESFADLEYKGIVRNK